MMNIAGSSGCAVAFLSISMRSNAAAPTAVETWGAMAASVWNTSTVTFSTRDGSTARMLAGNGVPSVIGISPPSSPGSRTPITCSTPFTSFVSSALPSTTTARTRPSPSWATYSPGDEVDVLNFAGKVLQLLLLQRREERNRGQLIDSEHDCLPTLFACVPAAHDRLLAPCPNGAAESRERLRVRCRRIHAEIVYRTPMAAHEASASKTARRVGADGSAGVAV